MDDGAFYRKTKGRGIRLTPLSLHGREEISTTADEITEENVVEVLKKALDTHKKNSDDIEYLYNYVRGDQPVLRRSKPIRPEINNKVVVNHAFAITQFVSGYFVGEPVAYVRRGERDGASDEIEQLNTYMHNENKASHDKRMATWMAVCGVGYRMILPNKYAEFDSDETPFEIDTPDPRNTFVVYRAGFGRRRMMCVRQVRRDKKTSLHNNANENDYEVVNCVYTREQYFEIVDDKIVQRRFHALRDLPIFEYQLNAFRMGSFESAITVLDTINEITSNRADGVAQFVQSFLKFINCDVDESDVEALRKLGAIKIKSAEHQKGDVELISQELNQSQTQTLVDNLYEQALVICGMPSTTKGGTSTSDTGRAVFLRDGWTQSESRAQDTETLFKESEGKFLKLCLRILRDTNETQLTASEVECKFTRRQYDNLISKSQALLQMLQAGLDPAIAIATCGLFNDPMDVASRSEKHLSKWDPKKEEPVQSQAIPEQSENIEPSERTEKTQSSENSDE